MKEFGIYTVDKDYLKEFLSVSNKLAELKITKRPFVCIKIGFFNWLVPLPSVNPKAPDYDYHSRFRKNRDYDFMDNQTPPKAMDIFDDPLKTGIKGFKSVALYYAAFPVKHKYCTKYRNEKGEHIVLGDEIGRKIRGRLINYLSVAQKGQFTGFIKNENCNNKLLIYG